ncbi:Peptidase S8 propeptide/proteinase inhibitor I9 superfamily protein [Pleurotus pulmonarius]
MFHRLRQALAAGGKTSPSVASYTAGAADKSARRYIIVFKPHVTHEQIEEYISNVQKQGGKVTHQYDIIKGFAANLGPDALSSLQALQGNTVESIEPDQEMRTQ